MGHVTKEYPNKQMVTLIEDTTPVYDTDNEEEAIELEDEVVYDDHGDALITQRVLNVAMSQTTDDVSWLRNNIFQTKCTTRGKVLVYLLMGATVKTWLQQAWLRNWVSMSKTIRNRTKLHA